MNRISKIAGPNLDLTLGSLVFRTLPVEYRNVSFSVSLKGLGGSTAAGDALAGAGAAGVAGSAGGGAGHSSSPSLSTMAPRVTSSSRSMLK